MIQDYLTDYQIKRIDDRLKLNFDEELKKSKNSNQRKIFSKNFRNCIDIFVNELYNNGILFYGFTIKMPFLDEKDPELWYMVHLQVEKWIKDIGDQIELIEFCYITIELENKLPFLKGLIGVRSILGQNSDHFNEIKKIFNLFHLECFVIELPKISLILKYWNFILKDNNFKFHRFTQYSLFFDTFYGAISDLENQYDDLDHSAFGLDENLNTKYFNIRGITDTNPDNFTIINYIITLYQSYTNYYINNNNLYKKKENSKYSWEIFDSIEYFNNNNIKIFEFIKEKFPQHLRNIKVLSLLNNSWDSFFEKIRSKNQYILTIDFSENIIEFFDGLYFFDKNYFFDFSKNNVQIKANSKIFYNQSYYIFKNNLPQVWLNLLSDNLKKKKIKDFCINLGYLFSLNKSFFESKDLLIKIFSIFNSTRNYTLVESEIIKIIIYCNNLYFEFSNIKKLK